MPRYEHQLPPHDPGTSHPEEAVPVFNLQVHLLKEPGSDQYRARLANMYQADCFALTPRQAIANAVGKAKQLIAECVAHDRQIPWVNPPMAEEEGESRMLVPVHL